MGLSHSKIQAVFFMHGNHFLLEGIGKKINKIIRKVSFWKADRFFPALYKYFLLGCSDVRNMLCNISLYKEKHMGELFT